MALTKEITRLEKSNVRMSVTVPKEDVVLQYQDVIRDYTRNAQIPGFRKGKVPKEVLERKFGEAFRAEALSKIIEKSIGEIFGDENMPKTERPLPYSQPKMDDEPKLSFDEDLHFALEYDVLPSVAIGQWKGLEVEIPDVAITDEDLARELEEVRERSAFVLDREDGAEARNGDVATINHSELGENGEDLPNSKREDFAFTLGKGQNAYMFDDDIIGMKKGDTKEIAKTYPEDGENKAMFAGQTKKFRITLTALKEKKLPDLDDDLAQDVDEKFKTLDDLKNSIKERLEKSLETQMKEVKINKLLEKIMENTPVVLPESMIQVELEGRLRNLARRFGTDTSNIMQMLSQSGDGLEDIQGKWRPSAERALHSRLIIETLMQEQHIEATDEELDKELEVIAEESGEAFDEIKKRYGEGSSLEYIKDNICEKKVFDLLIADNKVTTGTRMNYLDLMEKFG